jgi:TM2 domain-containing membrane protein YozV
MFNISYTQTISSSNYTVQIFQELKSNKNKKELFELPKFDTRRITGLSYSVFVPGSGQIYLGHQTKGAAFAVTFFTGLVGAIVSQNNFIGNRERIQNLQFEYLNSDRFTLADYYWKQMVNVHNEQKMHERARNIFTAATVFVWSLNLIDYLFWTDDKGPIEFSYNNDNNLGHIFSVAIPLN